MSLDGVAFSRLDWLQWGRIFLSSQEWGRTFSDFLGLHSSSHLRLANVPKCLYCRWKVKCSSFNLKKGSVRENRWWLNIGIAKITNLPKSDKDGVYNWPQNSHNRGRGSEMPAAHTKQKLTKVPPPPGGVIAVSWFFRSRAHAMCSE